MGSYKESIDTNIMLRIILGDNMKQREAALKLLRRTGTAFYLSNVAIAEMVFVLEKLMGYERADVRENLLRVLGAYNNIDYEAEVLRKALDVYVEHRSLSFDDCYLAEEAAFKTCEPLWTFDHKLAVQSGVAKEVR